MFLKTRSDGSLLEVMDLKLLFDPFSSSVPGKLHAGEELQDLEIQMKGDLVFPSGEALPECWVKPDYNCRL